MTRPVVWAVTLAMSLVLSVTCINSRDMTPEERACCASMGHDCGAAAIEKGCCSGELVKIDGVTPATASTLAAALAPALLAVLDATPVATVLITPGAGNTPALGPPGPPIYLLASTFRV